MNDSTSDATPDETSSPVDKPNQTDKRKARVALSILVAVHLAVCVYIAFAGRIREPELLTGLTLGLFFGQCSSLAVWAAWGPQKIIQRIPSTLFLLGLLALAFSNMTMTDQSEFTPTLVFAGVLLLQWFVMQLPLWAIRLLWKTQLVWPGQELSPTVRDDFRFSLKQIMIWTAAVAVLLGVGRLIFSAMEISDLDFSNAGMMIAVFLLFLIFNVLFALFTIWGVLSHWKPLLCFFLSMILVLIAGFVEAFILTAIDGGSNPLFEIFIPMTMVHSILLAGSLLLLRYCGFRLTSSQLAPTQ